MRPTVISEQDELKDGCNRPVRKRFTGKRLCFLLVTALVILAALLFYAVSKYRTPDPNVLLTRAKLAKLPESLKNLQVDTRPVMDNNRTEPDQRYLFIRFQAEPNDIDNFINNSPSIDKNSFRPMLPLPDSEQVPTWWPTDQSISGRIYNCARQRDIQGIVAVYDDSNTVCICVWYVVNPQLRDTQRFLEDLKDDSEDFVGDLYHEVKDALGY